ncbi:putative lipoprotein required for motility [Chitinispirillum alkaliphilum]|nr:putative lipoprotein required for motility [Chitinispirillum alkaliphilum]
MIFRRLIISSVLLFSLASYNSPVANVSSQRGSIDWQNRILTVTGIGAPPADGPDASKRPNAIRAAQVTAMRDALEILKGVSLTYDSDLVKSQIEGYIENFEQNGNARYMSDGTVEITYNIPLQGRNLDLLLPDNVKDIPQIRLAEEGVTPLVTGVIVDCRELEIVHSVLPMLFDESGSVVYGPQYVSRQWALKWGTAGFASDLDEAKAMVERIGQNPVVVRGISTAGIEKTGATISNEDAAIVLGFQRNLPVLNQCRIIFVTD